MIKIILHGCCGRMGHIITEICEKDENTQIVAGVDAFGDAYAGYPVFRALSDCPEADVVIDFSTASAMDGLLAYCSEKKLQETGGSGREYRYQRNFEGYRKRNSP